MTRQEVTAGIILAGVAIIIGWFTHPVLTITLGTLLSMMAGCGVIWRHRNAHSATLVNRWKTKSAKHQGVASFWTILRVSSAWAMRRKACILRPHLTDLSWWARWWTPITEYATPIMRAGWLRVYSPCEDVTIRFGGPRSGKSQELYCRILDAPGAVIATSTRPEIVTNTAWGRENKGPLYVFNPGGVGGIPSTITFSPLSGCTDPVVATIRAGDLLSAAGRVSGSDSDYWMTAATQSLSALLYAVALDGGTMWDVLSCISDPERCAALVLRLLEGSPGILREYAIQFFRGGDKYRASLCAIIIQSLSWLNDPRVAETTRGGDFDVEALIKNKGTLYLLGESDATLAPLLTAFTGHIAREARRIADLQPRGRLNPPLTIAADEAARICLIPFDEWTSDMGARNITIHISAQSRAQLRERWGDRGASAIINNAATIIVFGGNRDGGDLSDYSLWIPVLKQDLIAQLPAGHAVLVRRGMPPVVGKPMMVWRRHRRHRRRQLALTPVTALTTAIERRRLRRKTRQVPVRRPIAALPGGSATPNWNPYVASTTNRGSHD